MTIISSSRSGNPTDARNFAIGTSHRTDTPLQLNEMKQLFLQAPTEKVAARVFADTMDGKSTSIVIYLADQADVSAANR